MHIQFDTPRRLDRVTLAILPIDGFTGAIVPSGIKATISGLLDRAIVNASGMLVFINLPDQADYKIEVDGRHAGFFGPETFFFTPPLPDDPKAEEKRKVKAFLQPRPDYPFPAGATLIRGVVVRGPDPVAGATVRARPDMSQGDFTARSAADGGFALAVRRSPLSTKPLELDIHLEQGADARILTRTLKSGRSHSFRQPIDLTGTNEPDFFTI